MPPGAVNKIKSNSPNKRMNTKRAFTLIELLVVVAIIAILAGLLLPALAKAKMKAWNAAGLNNSKQLQLGATMYSADNNDYMIPNAPWDNSGGGAFPPNHTWCGGNGESWTTTGQGTIDNTNWQYYTTSLMAPYMGNNIGVYRCPADNIPSTDGIRLRSYSMNGQMGGVYVVAYSTTSGPYTYDASAVMYVKNGDLGSCLSPANAIVFMHESTYTLLRDYSDGWIQVSSSSTGFPDAPAGTAHNSACEFSFIDGHSEMHKWMTSCLNLPNNFGQIAATGVWGVAQGSLPASNPDWIWYVQHTACKRTGGLPP